jgi:transposase
MNQDDRARYPSDLSDEQWGMIEDLVPKPNPHPNFPKDEYARREIVNAIMYLLRTGCQWRHLPHDFPKWSLVAHYFYAWKNTGALDAIVERLRTMARQAQGRSATPTLGIIDSQSAKTTEVAVERGFDAGKKGQGQKASHPGRRVRFGVGGIRDTCERARP